MIRNIYSCYKVWEHVANVLLKKTFKKFTMSKECVSMSPNGNFDLVESSLDLM